MEHTNHRKTEKTGENRMNKNRSISPNQPTKDDNQTDIYKSAPNHKKLSTIIDADARQARKLLHLRIRAEPALRDIIIA